jgi:hypothetical protein
LFYTCIQRFQSMSAWAEHHGGRSVWWQTHFISWKTGNLRVRQEGSETGYSQVSSPSNLLPWAGSHLLEFPELPKIVPPHLGTKQSTYELMGDISYSNQIATFSYYSQVMTHTEVPEGKWFSRPNTPSIDCVLLE